MTEEELDLLSVGSVVVDEANEYYFKTDSDVAEGVVLWYCHHGEWFATRDLNSECEGSLKIAFEAKYR